MLMSLAIRLNLLSRYVKCLEEEREKDVCSLQNNAKAIGGHNKIKKITSYPFRAN